MENWMNLVISILSGLVVIIPLVYKLVEFVQKATREQNWGDLLELVTNLMKQAELKFQNGSDRKEWVMMMIKASADTINYDINMEVVSQLIDDLCEMSKQVNAPRVGTKVEEEIKLEE